MIFTKEQNHRIQECIINAELARMSEAETQAYVKQQLGFKLTHNQVMHRRRMLRQKRIGWMENLQQNRYAYRLVFAKRIEEIERSMEIAQKDMLQFTSITDPAEQRRVFFYKQKLTYQIIELNKQLVDLYLLLPMIDAAIARNNNHSNAPPITSQGPYQSLPEPESEQVPETTASDFRQDKF